MFSNITGINTTAANLDTVNKLNVKENETIIEIGNLFQDDNGTAVDKVDKDDKLSILEQIEDLKKQIEELEKQLNNKNDIIISTDTDNSAINDLFLQEQAVFEYSNYSIKTSEGIKALNIKTLNLYYNHNEDDFTSGNYRIIDKQGNVIDLKQIANDNDDGTSDSMLQQNLANGNWIIQAAKYGGDGKIKHDKSGNIMYISISLSHSKAFGTKGVSSAAEKAGQDAPVKNTGNTKSTNNTSNSDNIGTASNIKTQEQQIADELNILGNHITGNTTTDSTDLNAKLRAIKQEIYEKQIEMLQNLNNYDKKTKDENE